MSSEDGSRTQRVELAPGEGAAIGELLSEAITIGVLREVAKALQKRKAALDGERPDTSAAALALADIDILLDRWPDALEMLADDAFFYDAVFGVGSSTNSSYGARLAGLVDIVGRAPPEEKTDPHAKVCLSSPAL
jgi:hypothetical protein